MYTKCKEYLIQKLKTAGIQSNPYTTFKQLEKSMESHVGAVLFEKEDYKRNGSKTLYKDQEGAQKKRRKIFDRTITFTVVIGEYSDASAEKILEAFILALDKGINIDGNYTAIEPESADWVDKDDSILKAKVAVQVKVSFEGGVYKDADFAKVKEVQIESVIRNGKEAIDGE